MIEFNEKVAELIGMHIGDGTLYKTSRSLVWELRGSLKEKEYYYNTVKPLLETIFQIKFEPKFRSGGKNGCFGIQTSKKEVTNLFLDYGFKPGRKTHTARIPDYINKSSSEIKLAFLRGLFDTDGCIRFDRINEQKLHTYPRIELGFASKGLRDDLLRLMNDLEFRCFVWNSTNDYKICLGGKGQVVKWFNEVRPNNKKHLNKYDFWLKRGYYNAEVA